MSEEVINKWKDVSPEDIISEPNWEEGWELVHAEVVKVHAASEIVKEYIRKRFLLILWRTLLLSLKKNWD